MHWSRLQPITAILATFLSCGHAHAADFNIGLSANASVEAGLDAETRALIDKMPENIKNQTLDLIVKALPMLDASVYGYIDKVNDTIAHQLANASCTAVGTADNVITGAKHLLFGGRPAPVKDLRHERVRLETAFHANSAPSDYVDAYGDFLHAADITACDVSAGSSGSEALTAVRDIRIEVSRPWLTWRRLENSCHDADTCVIAAKDLAYLTMQQADPRDVVKADAQQRLLQVSFPPSKNWWERTFTSYEQGPAEASMADYLEVIDAINTAALGRKLQAIQFLKEAQDQLADETEKVEAASHHLEGGVYQCYTETVDRLAGKDGVLRKYPGVIGSISQAEKLAPEVPEIKDHAYALKVQTNASLDRAVSVATGAANRLKQRFCPGGVLEEVCQNMKCPTP
ncbi:hypothetical protein P5W99_00800 [Paraburkholderia sp. A3BS-1L]|uniref:hypothetical protein n=1 Tax=Paraburkholderia sp. A3BS-1L TaxID=3028375 RepID=UPI003DA7B9BA